MDEKMDDKGDGAQRRKSLPAKLILKSKNAPNLCGKSKIQKAKCAICSKRNKTTLPYCNACHKFAERFKKRDISMVCDKKDHCPVGACESRSPGLDYCRSCRYRRITQLDHNFAKGHNSDQNDCGQKADDTRSGQEHSPEASSSNVNSVNHSNYVVRKCEICVNMNYTRRPYCQACRKFAERKKKGEKLPVCKKKSCSGNGVSGSLNYCRACRYREIMKLDRSFYNNTIIDESTESMNAGCDDSTSVNVAVNVEGNMPEQLMNSAPSGSGTNNGNKYFKTQTCRPSVITHHNNSPIGFQPGFAPVADGHINYSVSRQFILHRKERI
ncbi:hypothetical protein DdX_21146 [Ditylenchus destructor]|uniref:Uncharacterized protein n=1 Tax=Ditylenchus destructor TaxID=166010 RepID=A0AAD4MFA7_9BILA|nr:hypothetical protein DdX_21146 [Ditylenchus destructor]